MKSKNNISNHIDALMQEAQTSERIATSVGFEEKLNRKLDSLERKQSKPSPIFHLASVFKYAALFLIVLLNISAILFLRNSIEQEIESEVAEHVEDFFPDYTLLTSLE